MKKAKKLSLSRETLRILEAAALARGTPAGASGDSGCCSQVYSCVDCWTGAPSECVSVCVHCPQQENTAIC
jgi:hypothetical protein